MTKFLLETFIFSDAAAGIFEEEEDEDDTCINKCAAAFPLSLPPSLSLFVRRSQFLPIFPCPLSSPLRRRRRRYEARPRRR